MRMPRSTGIFGSSTRAAKTTAMLHVASSRSISQSLLKRFFSELRPDDDWPNLLSGLRLSTEKVLLSRVVYWYRVMVVSGRLQTAFASFRGWWRLGGEFGRDWRRLAQ